jgi:hypothetical protein
VKSCFSSIKSAEATIEQLAVKNTDDNARQVFNEALQLIAEMKNDLEKQVISLTREEPTYK